MNQPTFKLADPFSLAVKPIEPTIFEMEDPDHPGFGYRFELLPINVITQGQAYELSSACIREYVTGDEGTPPMPFPPIGGKQYSPTDTTFHTCAAIYVMDQTPEPQKLSIEKIVALGITSPKVWDRLKAVVNKLNAPSTPKKETAEVGAEASGTGTPSATASS